MAFPLRPKTIMLWNATAMVQDTGTYSQVIENKLGYTRAVIRWTIASEVGTATFDLKVQAYNETAGTYADMTGVSIAQQTAAGSGTLTIGPGLTASANVVVLLPLPKQFKVVATIGDATTEGFTVTAEIELLP